MALSALVHVCQRHGIAQIDCQQNTPHLASLGAQEMPRDAFLAHMTRHLSETSPDWPAQTLEGLGCGQSLAAMESLP